jgi:squalene-hopene/tetraprenyl-beta-curcumene cyclase
MKSNRYFYLTGAVLALLLIGPRGFAEDLPGWKPEAAASYLDQRAEEWFAFPSAQRGEANTQTTCISCHTLAPYALARPLLRKVMGAQAPSSFEQKMAAQARMRVANWKDLDGSKLRLLYDFSDDKKTESWGTEAVVNATILAFADRHAGRTSASPETAQAFSHLWETQIGSGEHAGSWHWLNFENDPFESKKSPYFGSALAALALGSVPGREALEADPAAKAKIDLLRSHLQKELASQNLFNQAWALWASARLDGTLSTKDRESVVERLMAKQQDDGGWCLATLGHYVRHDKSAQASVSDGFATGLVLCAVRSSGVPKDDPRILKGMGWLKQNQQPTGEWRCESLNKKRNPSTNAGKLMTDTATAFAVLALAGEG